MMNQPISSHITLLDDTIRDYVQSWKRRFDPGSCRYGCNEEIRVLRDLEMRLKRLRTTQSPGLVGPASTKLDMVSSLVKVFHALLSIDIKLLLLISTDSGV